MEHERSSRPWVVALLGMCLLAVATMGLMRGPESPRYAHPESDPAVEIVGADAEIAPETMLHLRSTLDPATAYAAESWTLPGGGEPLVWERSVGPDAWEPVWYVYFSESDAESRVTRPHLEPYEERFHTLVGLLTDHVDVLAPPEAGTYRLCVGEGACVRLTVAG